MIRKGRLNNKYTSFNKIKFYYGLVVSVDPDYTIRFRIPELLDNLADEEYPKAHPILRHSSEIKVNDNVLIMQLDEDIQDFIYFSNDTSEFTGIEFKNNIIDISSPDELVIKRVTKNSDTGEITKVNSTINLKDDNIEINVGDNSKVSLNSQGLIFIGNTLFNLADIMNDLLTQLISLRTVGSPATQTISPDISAQLTVIQTKLSQLLSNS